MKAVRLPFTLFAFHDQGVTVALLKSKEYYIQLIEGMIIDLEGYGDWYLLGYSRNGEEVRVGDLLKIPGVRMLNYE